ncbi:plasminogen activator inhibitor 1 RNA-binding protein-like [Cucumis melo var. makuwa]|uniref:Plasminogen activator inhibitor 1 RNA-binding protein-like n=1 Tax=Cucumis melo var. makuwa TaxID=1194695 RepID=A0A5A7TA70_CUCMM|nr:plasminogen activator inhibitor 1 RNA-binding protein-like [Cucumis melo var. makuwa]
MATMNPFDLLVDDDNEDPNQLASAQRSAPALPSKKAPAPAQPAKPAKLPSKPLPPAQAGGFSSLLLLVLDSANNENGGRNGFSDRYQTPEDGEKAAERRGYGAPRGSFRGPRRGGFSNGEAEEGERPRRVYERRSGTGRGNEFKRDGAGRRNWGAPGDENAPDVEEPVAENEKNVAPEQQLGEDGVDDNNKAEEAVKEPEEKEPEDKEMTLKEYEKLREESRKLLAKTEVRKAEVDEELENMQQLSSKKTNDEIFAKLGTDKDKRKDVADKEERAKKSVTITEFLKPAEGERYYNPGGRGRGRGRGSRGGFNNGSNRMNVAAPSIEDPGQFPSLSAK